MEKLTEKEIEKLDKLLEVELKIFKIYKRLIDVELNNKSNQEAMINLVEEEINEMVAFEPFFNPEKAILATELLTKKIKPVLPGEEIDYFLNNDDMNRAINHLLRKTRADRRYILAMLTLSCRNTNDICAILKYICYLKKEV